MCFITFIDSKRRKIHTLAMSNLLTVNGSENTLYPLNPGVWHHPHLSGHFCLCLQCGQWLEFACLLLLLSVFSFSAGEKERARVCSRSCPFLVQLEQNFCVADHSKTDVSFIIIKKKKKTRKRKWSHPSKHCEFCSVEKDVFFILKEVKMCQAVLAINPHIQPEMGWKW